MRVLNAFRHIMNNRLALTFSIIRHKTALTFKTCKMYYSFDSMSLNPDFISLCIRPSDFFAIFLTFGSILFL